MKADSRCTPACQDDQYICPNCAEEKLAKLRLRPSRRRRPFTNRPIPQEEATKWVGLVKRKMPG